MAVPTREWVDFFKAAEIPAEESASYAIIFSRHRIQKNMLADLNKEYLKDMGITLLGDIIAILKHAKIVHESNSRAMALTEPAPPVVEVTDNIDLTKKKTPAPPTGSSATVKRLLDHYTRKFKQAEESLSGIPSTTPAEETNRVSLTSETAVEKKIARAKVHQKGLDFDFNEPRSSHKEKKLLGKNVDKKTVFQRLGDGTVSSTTPDSKPKKSSQNSPSIFLRLGEVSSTSLEVERLESAKDALPYAGLFKNSRSANSGVGVAEPSMRADLDKQASSSGHSKYLLKSRLGDKGEARAAKRNESLPKEPRTDFMKARELKMLKITAEFADDDDAVIEVVPDRMEVSPATSSANRMDMTRRKRKANDDSDVLDVAPSAKAPAKKVRFGGASHRIIPSANPEIKQKPSKLLRNFENLKIVAGGGNIQKEGIKSRIGRKPATAIHYKTMSETIAARPTTSKMVSDTLPKPIRLTPTPGKSRIEQKLSVLDRLG